MPKKPYLGDFKHTNVKLLSSQLDRISEICAAEGVTMTDVIRFAVKRDLFLRDAHDKGSKIIIEEPTGERTYLEFL